MPKSSERKKKGGSQRKSRRPKSRNPKVRLSKNKVAVFCVLVSLICVFSLALAVILSIDVKDAEKPAPQATRIEKKEISVKSQSKETRTEKRPEGKTPAVSRPKEPPKESGIPQAQQPAEKTKAPAEIQKRTENPVAETQSKASSSSQIASNKSPWESETIHQNVPQNRFDIPPAADGATIVIIIDDAGLSVENTKLYASLPFPITIAVLPRLSRSRACADVVRAAGKELILHQPMQSTNLSLDPGPGKITEEMSTREIAGIVKENLLSLGPGVKGMNNHEGSLVTSNVIKIGAVLEVCDEMGVYFLDSRTSAQTQARQAALERDMRIFEKAGPYLDNDIDRAKMLERMRETLAYANRHGRAIVIGHVDKSARILPELLAEMYPEMRAAGYSFATPSMLK